MQACGWVYLCWAPLLLRLARQTREISSAVVYLGDICASFQQMADPDILPTGGFSAWHP